jgi:GPH family glycoside/pentoside/hexuronide:cation symporter
VYFGQGTATNSGVVGKDNMYAAAAFCLGLLMAAGYFAHFKMTEGYEEIELPSDVKTSRKKTNIKDMFVCLFQNPTLMVLVVADLAKWCMNFIVAASAIYYFKYAANRAALQATYIQASSIAAVIGAYSLRYFSKSLTSRLAMIIAYIAAAICLLLVYFLYSNPVLVIVLMTIGMFFYGVQLAAAPALYADTVVYATWKSGKDASGWIMGLQNLPLKIAILLRGIIIPVVLASVGYDAKADPATLTEATRQGLTVPFALIPAIFLAVGALLLIFGFRLTREKVVKYQAEIDARKE